MAVIRPRHTVDAPATNLLSYIFDSPYKNENEGAWPESERLLVRASSSTNQENSRIPGYTITQIASLTKRIGNGLYQLGTSGKRVMVYGDANIHFPLAVLGVIASGAACNILPPCPVYYLVERLGQLECDTVLFAPEDIDIVCTAAKELGIPRERLFVVDETLTGNGDYYETCGVKHWSHLLDTPGGDTYECPNLSPSESKSTTALLLYTSGYKPPTNPPPNPGSSLKLSILMNQVLEQQVHPNSPSARTTLSSATSSQRYTITPSARAFAKRSSATINSAAWAFSRWDC